jgi:uncharacterized membrane protein
MKTTRIVAIVLAIVAVFLTALGGILDAWRGDRLIISKQHAWHDGIFLLLLALFLIIAF